MNYNLFYRTYFNLFSYSILYINIFCITLCDNDIKFKYNEKFVTRTSIQKRSNYICTSMFNSCTNIFANVLHFCLFLCHIKIVYCTTLYINYFNVSYVNLLQTFHWSFSSFCWYSVRLNIADIDTPIKWISSHRNYLSI